MNSKSIITSLLGILVFSLIFGYSLVFAGAGMFDNTVKLVFKLSNNIYTDSIKLKNTKVLFKSRNNLNDYKIQSECEISSKITYSKGNYYMFDINFLDNTCVKNEFILINENNEIKNKFWINVSNKFTVYSTLLDLKTSRLSSLQKVLYKKVDNYSEYKTYNKSIEKNYYKYLNKNRVLEEATYNLDIIKNILEKRSEKYLVPVRGGKINLKLSRIPNAGRPYRSSFTDGIHHGWDTPGDFGEQVIALDDAIVVRVISDFEYSDLDRIKYGKQLTKFEKTKNLDTLRGNQVWLKTMSGDVIFYSHLNEVFNDIKVGQVVKKGKLLGTIGITGVPDKKYNDYHLHFAIQKNPFNKEKIGKNNIDDYLNWDWSFKGKSNDYILDNWENIFEN